MARLAALLLATLAILYADKIENSGKPMRLPPVCKPGDLQSLGLTCAEDEPCPLYLELSAVESTGGRLFVTGNIHTSTTTISSILLGSDDSGRTWSEVHERIRFSALEQVEFIDTEYGWISGALIGTLPRDPFFLLTTDGGKTWNVRPLFEETHGGSIERFWFDSRKSGALFLTPNGGLYEMYQTQDGGESWTLKEASKKPLKMPAGAPIGDAGWRIRPNSRTHAFDIEMKQSGGWQRVASFLVEVGVCK